MASFLTPGGVTPSPTIASISQSTFAILAARASASAGASRFSPTKMAAAVLSSLGPTPTSSSYSDLASAAAAAFSDGSADTSGSGVNDTNPVPSGLSGELDPLLQFEPAFTYSLPVQLLMSGIVLTLSLLLLLHLLFTLRYHLPLSRTNFFLQIWATLVLLIANCISVAIVLTRLRLKARERPYMFDYIEILLPPNDWEVGAKAGWLALQAVVAVSCHMTHIQFLTLLFPSKLEVRLILAMLAPLALASCGLSFADLSTDEAFGDLTDAIRNVCNSTLTLLYTFGLLIWGLGLNRKRAWRTDGGTASFGFIAITLAVAGTAVNFLEVKEDRLRWLPHTVWCLLLWQSWVSFWWWVGSGMWDGEVEDLEKREEKKRRRENKRLERERRSKDKIAALEGDKQQTGFAASLRRMGLTGHTVDYDDSRNEGRSSARETGSRRMGLAASLTSRLTLKRRQRAQGGEDTVELRDMTGSTRTSLDSQRNGGVGSAAQHREGRQNVADDAQNSTISSSSSSHLNPFIAFLIKPSFINRSLARLRTAHDNATKVKAKEANEAAAAAEAAKQVRNGGVGAGVGVTTTGTGIPVGVSAERSGRRSLGRFLVGNNEPSRTPQSGSGDVGAGAGDRTGSGFTGEHLVVERANENECDWTDEEGDSGDEDDRTRRRRRGGARGNERGGVPAASDLAGRGMGEDSWWWRGAIRRWRLKDVSKF